MRMLSLAQIFLPQVHPRAHSLRITTLRNLPSLTLLGWDSFQYFLPATWRTLLLELVRASDATHFSDSATE